MTRQWAISVSSYRRAAYGSSTDSEISVRVATPTQAVAHAWELDLLR
jgi:hypothetical protein